MLHNSAHGEYSLSLKDNMVCCDYSEGFNLAGVHALTKEILDLAEGLDHWLLFQRPEPSAGITYDAIIDMMDAYLAFQQAGCKAVAIVERSPFVHVGKPFHPDALTMPIEIDKDEQRLLEWLETMR